MIKKLLFSGFLMSALSIHGQNLFTENFDDMATLPGLGWTSTNQSSPVGPSTWAQGGGTAFSGGGQAGGATSFALCNYNSTTGSGTISNWMISPVVNVKNGDIVTFYTRKGGTGTGTIYPDRLELRMSTNGAGSAMPSGGATGLGDYTNLLVSVNPDLTTTGFPFVWTQYSYTVSGVPTPTNVKFAFRYYVTSGGPSGDNSDIIGIDTFSVNRTMSTNEFFAENFSAFPNPASNVLNFTTKTNAQIETIQILDLNGRVVKTSVVNGVSEAQMNVSELNSGVYFVDIVSSEGKATSKFVKN